VSRKKGILAENLAIEYLSNKNFKVLEQNFYSKYGEIDIIAYKNRIYHFIEVKSGRNFESIYNITPKKIEKIVKTIECYLEKNSLSIEYQIDAVIINNREIEYIENITL